MCGIAGIVAYREAPRVDVDELLAIREAMQPRGPDGSGTWLAPNELTGFAHRRLAIIDLSDGGIQPMSTPDGRLTITFNGEIYNYRELRTELVSKGHQFRTSSDTEVILNLYRDVGPALVEQLRGMYAFAIWDHDDQSLLLARDPFGIKPLYYQDDGTTLRFASQVKALLTGSRGPAPVASEAGHVGFYLWGHVPEPHTLYRHIRALPAGSTLRLRRGSSPGIASYFSIREELLEASERPVSVAVTAGEIVRDALAASVQRHLVSDVPVSVFLSSGMDSTAIASLATESLPTQLHTLTLGFEEFRGSRNDETIIAERTAKRLGTTHHTRWVRREDFLAEKDRILAAMDQPSIDGVNTYFVSRAAAQIGLKVALSGIGGDELFAGYPSFTELPRMHRYLGGIRHLPALGRGFRRIAAPVLSRMTSPKFAGLLEYGGTYAGGYLLRRGLFMPWELPLLMDPDFVRAGWEELRPLIELDQTIEGLTSSHQKVSALETRWYMRNQLLRDSDWAGMAHSLEVRVPFVDLDLYRAIAPLMLKTSPTKSLVAHAIAPSVRADVANKPKTGFSVPVAEWFGDSPPTKLAYRGLRGWAQAILTPPNRTARILVLASEAFGVTGGIAKFNRDLLSSLCTSPLCGEVVALPRIMPKHEAILPKKLTYLTAAVRGKLAFTWAAAQALAWRRPIDLVICGHIHLLPLAWLASVMSRSRLVLVIHGIDAWQPTRSPMANVLAKRVHAFISVSELTRDRFAAWSGVSPSRGLLLPNCVDFSAFQPRLPNPELVARYGIEGKRVIMTMGRLVSAERYKGFDEVLNLMPALLRDTPDLVYLVVGSGSDHGRLAEKAKALGVERNVVFTGFVSETEKCDHYNLASAFVMPSRGEGFGIVFLEAMACGVPVVGSTMDGSREALQNGALGALVDPANGEAIRQAILAALAKPKSIPDGLRDFSFQNFERRVHAILSQAVG